MLQNDEEQEIEKRYECMKCHKNYKHKHILKRHLKFECGIEPQFQCSLCGHKSKRKYEMTVHIRTKHNILTDL